MGEGRATMRLAIPLIVGQLSHMLMGIIDTLMIGWVGVTELAASSFAISVIHLPLMIGIGMTMAVSVRVSQARGANDPKAARAALRHGLQIAVVIGALSTLLALALLPILSIFRQDPKVIEAVPTYFMLYAGSMIPAMASMAVKNHADAMNRPWPLLWITLAGVGLNVVLNWFFIFGHAGMPEMRLDGAGLATLLARYVTFFAMILWCVKAPGLREWIPYHWFKRPNMESVKNLCQIGFPTSMHLLAEVSAFVFAALMIGTLGETALASHQVALSCAALVFMIPLGLSMALTVRIGESWGAKSYSRMRSILVSGWGLGMFFCLFSASSFLIFHDQIAGLFINEPVARSVTAGLLLIAAAFQFSDSMQIISAGALRGLDDVRAPAWIAFINYWIISIPLGWVLAFPLNWGVKGVWWGITVGLTLTAVALAIRIWKKSHYKPPVKPTFVPY